MGYLDNSSITVDAILTKRGRELLARNDGSFNITQFALADDEIDYNLFNENHPNGSQYSGEAIENMNLIEAIPDENNIMRHKLISLQGVSIIPYLRLAEAGNQENYTLTKGINQGATLTPKTFNKDGITSEGVESFYIFRIADGRLVSSFSGQGGTSTSTATELGGANLNPFTLTVRGTTCQLTSVTTTSVFGSNAGLTTTITIIGGETGATMTIPFTVTVSSTSADAASAVPSTNV